MESQLIGVLVAPSSVDIGFVADVQHSVWDDVFPLLACGGVLNDVAAVVEAGINSSEGLSLVVFEEDLDFVLT
jgi:hypothetical protein